MGLYHSARGSVDYSVTGSPTIVDGVVSGFSYSPDNYIAISPAPTLGTNDFEIKTAFVANSIQGKRILATQAAGSTVSGISIIDDSRIVAYFYNGTSRSLIASSVSYTTDQKYYVIMYRKGTTIGIKVSTDNMSYTENTSTIGASDSVVFSTWLGFGINLYGGNAFDGSVDLNDTYIKVNGQPCFGICPIEVKRINYGTSVGYTKVGSPTIENNVITYANGSNHLNFTSDFPSFANNDIDMVVKRSGTVSFLAFRLNGTDTMSLQGTSGGALAFYLSGSPVLILYNASNYSYIRFHKEANGKLTLQAGNDGVNWAVETSKEDIVYEAFDSYLFIRYVPSGGAVYLDETYIKLNGKLWFYRPSTNYLVKDNKLIWADSGIYVQEPGSGSALDSNTVALYHFDDDLNEEVTNTASEVISGTPAYDTGEFDKAIATNLRIGQKGYVSDATSFTIDFWLYVSSASLAGVILKDESNYAYGIAYLGGGDYYTVGAWVAGATQITLPFPSGFTLLNTWHHIAYVYDKSAGKEYGFIDGAKVYEGSRSTHGKQLSLSRISSNCRIDEFRLSNIARWTSDFTVPTEPYGSLVPGAKNYATPNMAPVPAGYTYGTTTTTAIGYVDIPTQQFTAAPTGSTIGRDE